MDFTLIGMLHGEVGLNNFLFDILIINDTMI